MLHCHQRYIYSTICGNIICEILGVLPINPRLFFTLLMHMPINWIGVEEFFTWDNNTDGLKLESSRRFEYIENEMPPDSYGEIQVQHYQERYTYSTICGNIIFEILASLSINPSHQNSLLMHTPTNWIVVEEYFTWDNNTDGWKLVSSHRLRCIENSMPPEWTVTDESLSS